MPPQAQPPDPGQALSADSTVGANLPPEVTLVHLQDSRLLTVLLQVIVPNLRGLPQRRMPGIFYNPRAENHNLVVTRED